MFENLTSRLSKSLKNITGKGKLSHANIQDALRDVRKALLEADVALPVVKGFIEKVRKRAVGQEVSRALSPSQQFIKVVQDELTMVMGEANETLNLAAQPPAVVLMAGLQGAGKTTSVAKLAKYLQEREKKKVMVVSVDVYRPAAIKQLETLAKEVEATFFPSSTEQKPITIAKDAITAAKKQHLDVVLVDTAGRLAVDDAMMAEIQALQKAINPIETLFVIDAMIGQDAVNTAKAFNDALPLTGVILTKADRVASRILGMGDVLSLIEDVERKIDKEKAQKMVEKVQKGARFDLNDLKDQIQQMDSMGGMAGLLEKMPGMGNMTQMVEQANMGGQFKKMGVIIDSMTPSERKNPDNLNGSRKRRITKGSGTEVQDLNRLLKQHKQMAKVMKKMKGGGMKKMMQGLGGMLGGGGMPPGLGR
jgi:signal recognition particle subunit SRP54